MLRTSARSLILSFSSKTISAAKPLLFTRTYASVSPLQDKLRPPIVISDTPNKHNDPISQYILTNLGSITKHPPHPSGQHRSNISRVLPYVLPYEPYPNNTRRAGSTQSTSERTGDGIVNVIHLIKDGLNNEADFVISSGFIIEPKGIRDEHMVVTCSHTLDQLSNRYPKSSIYSFILSSTEPTPIPIISYPSSSISDLLICTIPTTSTPLSSLPVGPFPIYKGQKVLVHEYEDLVVALGSSGNSDIVTREWKSADMLGYRNYGWREVQPGTSSSLPYIVFSSRPSPGSSGGPIVDAVSGAVVGVVSGSRTISVVEGERGYGASAENIFELFSIPGFIPTSQKAKP